MPKLLTNQSELRDTTGDGGAAPLLKTGLWILAVGIASAVLTKTAFGGIGMHGPHTNAGWLGLMTAMMCLPFGLMLALLGGAKELRNRSMRKKMVVPASGASHRDG